MPVNRKEIMRIQKKRFAKRLIAVWVFAGAVAVSPAWADVIYSNFGPGNSYISGSAWGIATNYAFGESFTPGANYDFADAQLAMSGDGTNPQVYLYLESDNGGQPGSILDAMAQQFTMVPLPGSSVDTFYCTSCPTLSAGTTYWIVASTENGQTALWNMNSTGTSAFATSYSGSPNGPWYVATRVGGALEVDGTPLTSSTPEPGSLALLATGVAGLGFLLRRKRQSQSF
jgi:hypothetical protein